MRRHFFLVLALTALTVGCAAATADPAVLAMRSNPNEITRAQIEAQGTENVFDLIMVLNPMWLRKRGAQSFSRETNIQVYVDNAHYGLVEDLRRLRTFNVRLIRRLDGPAAELRYGTGHSHGVIDIYLQR